MLSEKLKKIHALYNLGVKKKKGKTVLVLKHTLRRSRFTPSRAYGSCLACQHFLSNLISFVNLFIVFCFSMLMPTVIHTQIKKRLLRTIMTSLQERINLALPTCFCNSITPRNFHATRKEILSSGKPIRSKNNFRGITMVRGSIWGINSLSTFILS